MKGLVGLAVALLLGACTSDAHPTPASGGESDPTPFLRSCGSAVFGDPNMRNAVSIGPLILVGIPQAAKLPPTAFEEDHGRYDAIKILAVVKGQRDVTVTVPASLRESLALLYDPNASANKHGYPFSAGDARVTFAACPEADAGYNGGFIATQPTCATLEVETETSSDSGSLSIGRGACP